jgi:hypothetical protein
MALQGTIGGNGTLFVGEDKTFDLELLDPNSVPVDMSTMTIVFDVRLKDTSPTSIFTKPAAVVGVYNVVRATNTQRARVSLTDEEMNTVKARTYRQSWKRTDEGAEIVLEWGDFMPEKASAA